MSLEAYTGKIADMVASNPTPTDPKSQGDDHLRGIKFTMQQDCLVKSGPNVISVNSSSDAIRITQTGTGNALLVEDSANPDSTPFVVDASGNVVVGATSASGALNATTYALQQHGSSVGGSGFAQFNSSPTASAAAGIFQAKSNSGGAVANGDRLGQWQVLGHDGTSFVSATAIRTEVDGTPDTGSMPGRLVFSTTASGSSTTTERMRIDSAGQVLVTAAAPTAANSLTRKDYVDGTLVTNGIKMADGTLMYAVQLSMGTVAPQETASNAFGFATPFVGDYQVVANTISTTPSVAFVSVVKQTASLARVYVYNNNTESSANINVSVIAIGRWK